MTRTTALVVGLAAAASAATAAPSIAAPAAPTPATVSAAHPVARPGTTPGAPAGSSCRVRNPGQQPTDVDDAVGQDPDRVTQGLNWYITASTNPASPGVHVENWGHQWFTDVRENRSGVHVATTMVGGQRGDRYWAVAVTVNPAKPGVGVCGCPPSKVGRSCASQHSVPVIAGWREPGRRG